MNALADPEVGTYLNEHFVSSFQKVGTFRIVNGQKQGGNVATYFCLPDGRVLHALAGPVDAATLLREARWIVETRKMALVESKGDAGRFQAFFRKAHEDRLQEEHGLDLASRRSAEDNPVTVFAAAAFDRGGQRRNLDRQAQVHVLLVAFPLVKIELIYGVIFEKILNEKVSTLPVVERG